MAANMDLPKNEPKLSNMVMCGDHPSFTKTELNVKDVKMDDKEKLKEKSMSSHTKISPSPSRSERADRAEGAGSGRARAASEHALRMLELRRRRERPDLALQVQKPIAQGTHTVYAMRAKNAFPWAALGSFRWPPYLLAVWVLVLVLTHVLHFVVSVLERTLPGLRKSTQYFRQWTEDTWKVQTDLNQKLFPIGLAIVTGVLYVMYYGLYILYGLAVWAIEPICSDVEEPRPVPGGDVETKVTDYVEAANSKTSSNIKQ